MYKDSLDHFLNQSSLNMKCKMIESSRSGRYLMIEIVLYCLNLAILKGKFAVKKRAKFHVCIKVSSSLLPNSSFSTIIISFLNDIIRPRCFLWTSSISGDNKKSFDGTSPFGRSYADWNFLLFRQFWSWNRARHFGGCIFSYIWETRTLERS